MSGTYFDFSPHSEAENTSPHCRKNVSKEDSSELQNVMKVFEVLTVGVGLQRQVLPIGIYRLHLHCNFSFPPLSSGSLFGLIFETEDGRDKFCETLTSLRTMLRYNPESKIL
jgi:hypothetical protein